MGEITQHVKIKEIEARLARYKQSKVNHGDGRWAREEHSNAISAFQGFAESDIEFLLGRVKDNAEDRVGQV